MVCCCKCRDGLGQRVMAVVAGAVLEEGSVERRLELQAADKTIGASQPTSGRQCGGGGFSAKQRPGTATEAAPRAKWGGPRALMAATLARRLSLCTCACACQHSHIAARYFHHIHHVPMASPAPQTSGAKGGKEPILFRFCSEW